MTKFTYNLATLVMIENNDGITSKTKFKNLQALLEDKQMVIEYSEENKSEIEIIVLK